MATEEKPHRGKGHPALTEAETLAFIRERGRPVKTSELAEEFNVSDVGVRKRLKEDFKSIDTMKVRNRRIFFPAFGVDEEDEEEEGENRAEESDGQTVTMHQLGGKRIATTAAGLVAVQYVVSQVPVQLPVWSLLPAALVGVALIAWGIAPLIRATGTSADEGVSADV